MTYIDFFKACALTSAAAPKLDIAEAGARPGEGDEKIGVNALEIRTASNRRCVSYLSRSQAGILALKERERAEGVLEEGLDLSPEGVKVERPLLGRAQRGLEGEEYFVLICSFSPGSPSPLRGLSEEECLSFGKAVGAVHSKALGPFHAFRSFSAPSIRFELGEWIERLRNKGLAPEAVLDAWGDLAATDALWDFSPSLVHGGWKRGEARFAGGAVSALSKWERAEVSDPARDLEWMFEEGPGQRQADAFMQGYGMAMGDRMDPFILPRAKLWRQMEMGAALLEAERCGERKKAEGIIQKLLRLSAELRSLAPKKPEAPLPEGMEPPAAPPQQEGAPSAPAPSSTRVQPKADPEPGEGAEGDPPQKEAEEKAPERDPAINAALWQVAVRAALAQREGRDLEAELEAQKAAAEAAEDPEEKPTSMFFRAMSFAVDKEAPSLGAPVRVKEGGSAREGGSAPAREKPEGPAQFSGSAPSPAPPEEPSGSTTKVIDRIDGNANE
ncbi:MAG: phosphotransferase [Aeriscardovia sp.]|nr:phosphotransferase [Aeriscardovia sp.]